jgi:hypothetical protein
LSDANDEDRVRSFVQALNAGTPGDAQAGLRVFKARPVSTIDQAYGAELAKSLQALPLNSWTALQTPRRLARDPRDRSASGCPGGFCAEVPHNSRELEGCQRERPASPETTRRARGGASVRPDVSAARPRESLSRHLPGTGNSRTGASCHPRRRARLARRPANRRGSKWGWDTLGRIHEILNTLKI